jgi:hypothetical protein
VPNPKEVKILTVTTTQKMSKVSHKDRIAAVVPAVEETLADLQAEIVPAEDQEEATPAVVALLEDDRGEIVGLLVED